MKNRREIIFIYDVVKSNPNGDPDNGNRPRMDEQGRNIVTDLRVKRTIRDYWIKSPPKKEGFAVLVREEYNDDGNVMSMGDLIRKDLGLSGELTSNNRIDLMKQLPSTFIDVRTFGCAATLKGANVSITGPVQFGIGVSLNKPEIMTIPISPVVSAKGETGTGTLGEFHIINYSLICFHAIASEKHDHTNKYSDEDLGYLFDGLWKGTLLLNTRSKFNHRPVLLMAVVSKEDEFQIGGLDSLIVLENEDNITERKQVRIIADPLLDRLKKFKEQISHVELKEDDGLTFVSKGKEHSSLKDLLSDFTVKIIS